MLNVKHYEICGLGTGGWTGSPVSLSQTDPTTLDFASSTVTASGAGNSYSVALNNIVLTQAPLNTGHADLRVYFNVEYSIGGSGLASLPVSFPNFLVSGTVQNVPLSYTSITGTINYTSIDITGVGTLVDQVNHNWLDNTPGSFNNVLVSGTPNFVNTPALGANTSLDVQGLLIFVVDPASINVETVPEPSALALAVLGATGLFAWRRRLKA